VNVALCTRDDCDLPAPGGRLCPAHRLYLTNDLAALPTLIRELETTVTGQATTHGGFDWNASSDANSIGMTLRVWCRELAIAKVTAPERGLPLEGPAHRGDAAHPCTHTTCRRIRRDRTVKPLDRAAYWAAWLHANLPIIDRQPWAGQFADEIEFCRRSATWAVDTRTARIHLADCWHDTDGAECGQPLWARGGQQIITCPRCGAHYDVDERRTGLLQVAEDALMTAPEIARGLPAAYEVEVSYATLRKWIERRRVVATGDDPQGRALYRVGDVLALAREHAARPERRRPPRRYAGPFHLTCQHPSCSTARGSQPVRTDHDTVAA
jgi:hypothetical protein